MHQSIFLYQSKLKPQAFDHFIELCQGSNLLFILGPSRLRQLGVFRSYGQQAVSITINHDMNPDFFFFVLLHEWAHYLVFQQHGRSVAPHGIEWKICYQKLLIDAIALFPADMQEAVMRYAQNPKANLTVSPYLLPFLDGVAPPEYPTIKLQNLDIDDYFSYQGNLYCVVAKLRKNIACFNLYSKECFDVSPNIEVRKIDDKSHAQLNQNWELDYLLPDEIFEFEGQAYQAIEKKRSKYLCKTVNTQKQYIIDAHVKVKLISQIDHIKPHLNTIVTIGSLKLNERFHFRHKVFELTQKNANICTCLNLNDKRHYDVRPNTWVQKG